MLSLQAERVWSCLQLEVHRELRHVAKLTAILMVSASEESVFERAGAAFGVSMFDPAAVRMDRVIVRAGDLVLVPCHSTDRTGMQEGVEVALTTIRETTVGRDVGPRFVACHRTEPEELH
jgi:hypothetical protein